MAITIIIFKILDCINRVDAWINKVNPLQIKKAMWVF